MNTDVKDILNRIRVQNPVVLGGIALLVVAIAAFSLTVVSLANNVAALSQAEADLGVVEDGIEQILSLQHANPEALQRQIGQTKLEIAELLVAFPTTAEAVEQAARLYEDALLVDVQLVSLDPLRNTPEEETQAAYTVQRYSIVAQGAVPGLLRLIGRLGSRPLATMRVTHAAIQAENGALANVDLIIYASDLALEERRQLATVDPATVAELEELAEKASTSERWEEVANYAVEILELEPLHVEASLWLYEAYVALAGELEGVGELEQARQQFEAALQIRPEGTEALAGLERLWQP